MKGTPHTLPELLDEFGTHTRERLRMMIRDYLAQKFTKSRMKDITPETDQALNDLWFDLTGEKK